MSPIDLRVNVPAGMGLTLVGLLAPALHRPALIRHGGPGQAQEQLRLSVDGDRDSAVATLAATARRWQALLADCLPVDAPPPEPAAVAPPRMPRPPVAALGLSLRCTMALERAGVIDLRDLARFDTRQLLALPHLGRRQVAEIVDVLAALGMEPGTRWPD